MTYDKITGKFKRPYDDETDRELFMNEFDVASGTECTGLIPTPPPDDYSARSYSDIYDIPLSADPHKPSTPEEHRL